MHKWNWDQGCYGKIHVISVKDQPFLASRDLLPRDIKAQIANAKRNMSDIINIY